MSQGRQTIDMKDTVTILTALATHNPFYLDTDNNLRNTINGVNADSNVNADTANSVKEKMLSSMNLKEQCHRWRMRDSLPKFLKKFANNLVPRVFVPLDQRVGLRETLG